MNNIHTGHRKRMREKFLKGHAESFCDHELLEMLLFYCIPVANTNNIAHEMINTFGGISGVFSAGKNELSQIKGINTVTAEKIFFIGEFIRKYRESSANAVISDYDSIVKYFVNYFGSLDSDVCLLVGTYPDSEFISNISIPLNLFIEGKISVNTMARTLLKKNMHRIVIAINHSRGNPIPTHTDNNIVQFFSENLKIFDIVVDDCFICSGNKVYSFMSRRLYSINISDSSYNFETKEKEFLKKFIMISESESNSERICNQLLENFGSIYSIIDSDIFYMKGIDMKERTAILINIISEMDRKCRREEIKRYINDTDAAKKYFEIHTKRCSVEMVSAIVLNKNFCVLNHRLISSGGSSQVASVCRKFAECAIFYDNAKYMIISHNHPSGNPEPSQSDIFYTENLVKAMKLVNINVLDHIIVGRNKSVSMKQRFDIFSDIKGYKKSCP